MTCEEARQRWMEDELNPEVRRHQAECAGCREAMVEYVALLNLMDEWSPRQEIAPDFEARLYQRIRAHEAALGRRRGWWFLPEGMPSIRWSLVGAVLSLVLICGGVLYHVNQPRPQSPSPLPIAQVAKSDPVVRDLQVLDQDSDMLENFDLLNGSIEDGQVEQTQNR